MITDGDHFLIYRCDQRVMFCYVWPFQISTHDTIGRFRPQMTLSPRDFDQTEKDTESPTWSVRLGRQTTDSLIAKNQDRIRTADRIDIERRRTEFPTPDRISEKCGTGHGQIMPSTRTIMPSAYIWFRIWHSEYPLSVPWIMWHTVITWQWTRDVTRVDSVIQIAKYLLTNSHTVFSSLPIHPLFLEARFF